VGDAKDASSVVSVCNTGPSTQDLLYDIVELEGTLLQALERAWRVDDLAGVKKLSLVADDDRGPMVSYRPIPVSLRLEQDALVASV